MHYLQHVCTGEVPFCSVVLSHSVLRSVVHKTVQNKNKTRIFFAGSSEVEEDGSACKARREKSRPRVDDILGFLLRRPYSNFRLQHT